MTRSRSVGLAMCTFASSTSLIRESVLILVRLLSARARRDFIPCARFFRCFIEFIGPSPNSRPLPVILSGIDRFHSLAETKICSHGCNACMQPDVVPIEWNEPERHVEHRKESHHRQRTIEVR